MKDISQQFKSLFGERLKENEPLSKYTNFRIGGPARWMAEAKSEDEVAHAVRLAREGGVPVFVLGGGSNTLASDEGFAGLVLKIGMRGFRIEGTVVVAEAGAITASVARAAAEAGLAGFEWAISLPGTIGGAVRGNAGCFGGEMKDAISSVRVLRNGTVLELRKEELGFGYRESVLKRTDDIIVSARLELKPGDAETLKRVQKETLEKRKAKQPLYAGSAGCVFKNFEVGSGDAKRLESLIPPEMLAKGQVSAGWIVDALDLKGMKIGGAEISKEHGNFIVNAGGATASDVMQLVAIVKTRARDRFGIQLHEEVALAGF